MKTGFFSLTPQERPQLVAHFLRLSKSDRRLRFGMPLGDDTLQSWCEGVDLSTMTGYFHFGELVAVAMLCDEGDGCFEFAISVDAQFRRSGLAGRLLEHAMQQPHLSRLVIRHASDNTAMARVHRAYPSRRHLEMGEVDVRIDAEHVRSEHLQALGLLMAAEAD